MTKYANVMSDEEFERAIDSIRLCKHNSWGAIEILLGHRMTHSQMDSVCGVTRYLPCFIAGSLVRHPDFDGTHHFNTYMRESDLRDRAAMYSEFTQLNKDQIEIGLSDSEYVVRELAFYHPACTDEQKVSYHLKWGD